MKRMKEFRDKLDTVIHSFIRVHTISSFRIFQITHKQSTVNDSHISLSLLNTTTLNFFSRTAVEVIVSCISSRTERGAE